MDNLIIAITCVVIGLLLAYFLYYLWKHRDSTFFEIFDEIDIDDDNDD